MNGCYGGLGAQQGAIFSNATCLAAAVTARGRWLITWVARCGERMFWTHPETGAWGEGADRPSGARALECIYGDTGE